MNNIQALADSFVNTDTAAIRDDVTRLGGVEAAAEYCASMASGQPDWEPLASDEGRAALCRAIRNIVELC